MGLILRKSISVVLLTTAVAFHISGQEGIYHYGPNARPVEHIHEAVTITEVKRRSENRYIIRTQHLIQEKWVQVKKERIRIERDQSQVIQTSSDRFFPKRIYRKIERTGPDEYHFAESTSNATLRTGTSTRLLPLHLEGKVTEYHPNNTVKSVSTYRNNQLVSNKNWLPDGTRYIDSIFYSADREPEYQMGDEFFKAFLLSQLTKSTIDFTQIEDQVVVGWVVMETGYIDGVITLKGKSRRLNEYLVSTISALPGTWQPAMLDGSPVRYFMSIPLNFMHREARFQEVDFSAGVLHYNTY